MPRCLLRSVAALSLLALAACGRSNDDALEVAFIAGEKDLLETGLRLSPAGAHVRAATAGGLVGLDAEGQVVPALADRWIVTDDGRSYIFRLRDLAWPDGTELTGEDVRDALRRLRRELRGTTLGADLAQISDIRAMTGKVVEIRLANPMPDFLQLLAQPELGLLRRGIGLGPMAIARRDDGVVLTMLSPAARGLPQVEDWERHVRPLRLHAVDAKTAVAMFGEGTADVVIGGGLESLPLVETGPLSRGTVRIEPALGLFGLRVLRAEGFLEDAANREALSLAIDRDGLLAPFAVGGWISTTRVIPATDGAAAPERWADSSLDERRAFASRRVAAWESGTGEQAFLRIAMPDGPGGTLLFGRIAADLTAIGITAVQVTYGDAADLQLTDTVARYGEPQWFLNQFHCGYRQGLCSAQIDALVARAQRSRDSAEASTLLAQAGAELAALEAFVPFGQPLRWSLVRSDVTGFAANRLAFHPLPPLAEIPR